MKKNKVLILYHTCFGRNDGPPLYYFNQLKQRDDVEVTHLIPQGDISRFGEFDYTFWVDYGEDGLPVDQSWEIPKECGKTIYIASDTHINEAGRNYRFEKAKKFDYVFFNQVRAFYEYIDYIDAAVAVTQGTLKQTLLTGENEKQKIFWLPHAVEPQAYPHYEILKKYDISFIGHMQTEKNYNGITRIDALDHLCKEIPNFYYGTRHPAYPGKNMFEDAAKKFSQSKVVFNISIKDDINMRVFEAMATGSLLLTNWIPTLSDLFTDGKHLVTYKTIEEAIRIAKYYINHDEEREWIASAGMKEVLAKHTYKKRLETILSLVSL